MRILVFSDSHSSLAVMRRCMDAIRPDAVIHLGDYVADGQVIAEENPDISFYQLPGNCDLYRVSSDMLEVIRPKIDGVSFFLTHGHRHNVKFDTWKLIQAAKSAGAQVALYGHTHIAECRLVDGMWLMNPGSCGYFGGSAGLVETDHGKVVTCRLLNDQEMEGRL